MVLGIVKACCTAVNLLLFEVHAAADLGITGVRCSISGHHRCMQLFRGTSHVSVMFVQVHTVHMWFQHFMRVTSKEHFYFKCVAGCVDV